MVEKIRNMISTKEVQKVLVIARTESEAICQLKGLLHPIGFAITPKLMGRLLRAKSPTNDENHKENLGELCVKQ